MARKARRYFTLLTYEGDHCSNPWAIEFGDYDRETVQGERDDYRDRGWKAKHLKIIETGPTQAEIDAAVAKLNDAEPTPDVGR